MQPGATIHGMQDSYEVLEPLGTPGLYGQAFLCRPLNGNPDVVVKALQPGAPSDGRQVLSREAKTLERVAAAEEATGQRYAVRLLDRSKELDQEVESDAFIVMERASGANVLDEIVAGVYEWDDVGLDEEQALQIALSLAKALCCVHQAGLLYDDMKLENLFWDKDSGRLTIIDWNVVSEIADRGTAGVAGDWARFGARLYELRTGERLGLDRDGALVGSGPAGPRWGRLPEGVRDIIDKALSLSYKNDTRIVADLEREHELLQRARAGHWEELLRRAEVAAGREQAPAIDILAPLARAEAVLRSLSEGNARRDGLERSAELRSSAEASMGRAADSDLNSAFLLLRSGNSSLALTRFQQTYRQTRQLDPRPRRGLWLAQISTDHPDRYASSRDDLEKAVELLNDPRAQIEDLQSARRRLDLSNVALQAIDLFEWLCIETDLLISERSGQIAAAINQGESLRAQGVTERFPDLKQKVESLAALERSHQQNEEHNARNAHLRAKYDQALKNARRAEIDINDEQALLDYQRAADLARSLGDDEEYLWLSRHCELVGSRVRLRKLAKRAEGIVLGSEHETQQVDDLFKRALTSAPELKPLFALFRRAEPVSARQLADFKDQLAAIQTDLGQLVATRKEEQGADQSPVESSSEQSVLASIAAVSEVEGVRELIHQGMLARAQARLTAIQESISGFRELKQLEDALEERRKRARDAAENAKSALEKQDLRGAADALDQALTLEADNSEHYDLIDNALQVMRKQFQDCDGRVKTMREQRTFLSIWGYLAQELGNEDYVYFCAHIFNKSLAQLREKPLDATLRQQIKGQLANLKRMLSIAIFAAKLRQKDVTFSQAVNSLRETIGDRGELPAIYRLLSLAGSQINPSTPITGASV